MHYQYHDGLLEQASLDASDRSAVLTFLLYAVFDRTRARVSLRFEGIYNFAAVQAYFAKVLSDADPEADDCLDRCDAPTGTRSGPRRRGRVMYSCAWRTMAACVSTARRWWRGRFRPNDVVGSRRSFAPARIPCYLSFRYSRTWPPPSGARPSPTHDHSSTGSPPMSASPTRSTSPNPSPSCIRSRSGRCLRLRPAQAAKLLHPLVSIDLSAVDPPGPAASTC